MTEKFYLLRYLWYGSPEYEAFDSAVDALSKALEIEGAEVLVCEPWNPTSKPCIEERIAELEAEVKTLRRALYMVKEVVFEVAIDCEATHDLPKLGLKGDRREEEAAVQRMKVIAC